VPQLDFRTIGTDPFQVLGQTIHPIRLNHGPRFQVLGFRIGNLAYCTDTDDIPAESWPRLSGLETLILDALRHKPHPTHFSLAQAIDVAHRVGARQTYFTHVSHDLDYDLTNASLPPRMALAYDGLKIPWDSSHLTP
jgi:phosphoribosyl 1,2-cyclic phosphate phosphodiesterase